MVEYPYKYTAQDAIALDNYKEYLLTYCSIEALAEHYDVDYDYMFESINRGRELFEKETQ